MLTLYVLKQITGFSGTKSTSAWIMQGEVEQCHAYSFCLINMLSFDMLPQHRMNRAYMTNKYSRNKGEYYKILKKVGLLKRSPT